MGAFTISGAFSQWKIWVGISIGLIVSLLLLFSALRKEQFLYTPESGNYTWVDHNKDGVIQMDDPDEFILSPQGNYTKQTLQSVLAETKLDYQSVFWLLIAVLCMVGRDFFYILRIKLITNGALSWIKSFRVIMVWEFASAISPGVVGGAAVAMFILNRERIALGRSTAIVVVTAIFDNLFYLFMIPIVFLFIDQQDLFPQQYSGTMAVQTVFWIGFGIILLVSAFLFSAVFLYPQLAQRTLLVLFSIPGLRRWKNNARLIGADIITSSKEIRYEPLSLWVKVFFATIGSWVSRYLVINAILQAFIGFGFKSHIIILGKQLVLWLFMLISPTPGGSGVAEYAFTELLGSLSVSAILLAGMALIWRLISYFPYLFIGSIMVPRWIKTTSASK
jgi:uncharacterized protein (TIRG00374 family)